MANGSERAVRNLDSFRDLNFLFSQMDFFFFQMDSSPDILLPLLMSLVSGRDPRDHGRVALLCARRKPKIEMGH